MGRVSFESAITLFWENNSVFEGSFAFFAVRISKSLPDFTRNLLVSHCWVSNSEIQNTKFDFQLGYLLLGVLYYTYFFLQTTQDPTPSVRELLT